MATGADPSTDRHVPRVGRVEVDLPQPVVGSLYALVCVGRNPKLVTDLFVRPPIVWVIEGAPRSILGHWSLQLVQYSAHLVVDVEVVQRPHQGVWSR